MHASAVGSGCRPASGPPPADTSSPITRGAPTVHVAALAAANCFRKSRRACCSFLISFSNRVPPVSGRRLGRSSHQQKFRLHHHRPKQVLDHSPIGTFPQNLIDDLSFRVVRRSTEASQEKLVRERGV